jgi:hypothetical protein
MVNNFVDIGLPEKISITREFDSMTIIRSWFGWEVTFITLFAVIWNGIIIKDYLNIEGSESLPWIHILAGVAVSYYAITGWFNKTDIKVTKQYIDISHKPLPWIGNKKIDSNDIKQLYGKEKISRSNNSSSVTYEVHVIMNSGNDTKLLSGLASSEQALYIEQEIEKYLGIKNKPVRGELG